MRAPPLIVLRGDIRTSEQLLSSEAVVLDEFPDAGHYLALLTPKGFLPWPMGEACSTLAAASHGQETLRRPSKPAAPASPSVQNNDIEPPPPLLLVVPPLAGADAAGFTVMACVLLD